jgi:D-ribose pyranase
MKKIGIINSQISAVIASMGHNDTLAIVDAGYPIPLTVERIDLALEPGVPGFLQTLKVVLQELYVERIILAEEIQQHSPHILKGVQELLPDAPIQFIPHEAFKRTAPASSAFIRTAEFTPFSNIILVAGAWGFKL